MLPPVTMRSTTIVAQSAKNCPRTVLAVLLEFTRVFAEKGAGGEVATHLGRLVEAATVPVGTTGVRTKMTSAMNPLLQGVKRKSRTFL